MKLLIKESRVKSILKDKFGFDLTGKIKEVNFYVELPASFRYFIPSKTINGWLNNHGPIYVLTNDDGIKFMYQNHYGEDKVLSDSTGNVPKLSEFKEDMEIPNLGITISELISMYL